MANGGEDSRALQEFRRNFFGISREHAPMPESYLRELQPRVPWSVTSVHLCQVSDRGLEACPADVVVDVMVEGAERLSELEGCLRLVGSG
jgi:hypothetical protein